MCSPVPLCHRRIYVGFQLHVRGGTDLDVSELLLNLEMLGYPGDRQEKEEAGHSDCAMMDGGLGFYSTTICVTYGC